MRTRDAVSVGALTFSWAERLGLPSTYGPAVLDWLRACNGARVIGTVEGGVLVRRGFSDGQDAWWIIDNGGELNVERVNDPETLCSIPYTWHDRPVNAVTLGSRLFQAMAGRVDQIDWSDLEPEFTLDERP